MSHDFVVISLCFTFTCNNFTSTHNKFYVSEKMPIYRNNIPPAIGSKVLCMLCAWSIPHTVWQYGNNDNNCSVSMTHIT